MGSNNLKRLNKDPYTNGHSKRVAEYTSYRKNICVADSFDSMNTDRVYREKLPIEHIINEIEKNKDLQFDPAITDIMLRLLRGCRIVTAP